MVPGQRTDQREFAYAQLYSTRVSGKGERDSRWLSAVWREEGVPAHKLRELSRLFIFRVVKITLFDFSHGEGCPQDPKEQLVGVKSLCMYYTDDLVSTKKKKMT